MDIEKDSTCLTAAALYEEQQILSLIFFRDTELNEVKDKSE